MTTALSPRQSEVLDLVRQSFRRHGFPPTLRELKQALGIVSSNAVAGHLKALERKGRLRLVEGTARGIELVVPPGHCPCCQQPMPKEGVKVPLSENPRSVSGVPSR